MGEIGSELSVESRSSSEETVIASGSGLDAAEVQLGEQLSFAQLIEQRDRYKTELQDKSERLRQSAAIIHNRLLRKLSLMERRIRLEKQRKQQSDKTCQTDRSLLGQLTRCPHMSSWSRTSSDQKHQHNISYPACFLRTALPQQQHQQQQQQQQSMLVASDHPNRYNGSGSSKTHQNQLDSFKSFAQAPRPGGYLCEALDLAVPVHPIGRMAATPPLAGSRQQDTDPSLLLGAQDAGYGTLTDSLSGGGHSCGASLAGEDLRLQQQQQQQQQQKQPVPRPSSADSGTAELSTWEDDQARVIATAGADPEEPSHHSESPAIEANTEQGSGQVSQEPASPSQEISELNQVSQEPASSSQEISEQNQASQEPTNLRHEFPESSQASQDSSQEFSDSDQASQESGQEYSEPNQASLELGHECAEPNKATSQEFSAAEETTADRLKRLAASIRFDSPTCPAELESGLVGPFPSLPNSRLQALGLLPASLADLESANAEVSIVDASSRYRMEGPPSTAQPDEQPEPTADERIRELAISFSSDAATIAERVKRVSLARASLEGNLASELAQLEAALAGTGDAAALASVRILRDASTRLNRTAEVLGAVEQECRLNFAFHLIYKQSDQLRSEKEKMSGELEMLRQAVEDEAFYADGDGSLGKYTNRAGGSTSGGSVSGSGSNPKARAKFQQLGRSVARTTSVTGLLQRLTREREKRRRLLEEAPGGTSDEADGMKLLPEDSEVFVSGEAASPLSPAGGKVAELPAEGEVEKTVLDRLDRLSARLFADRRVRLFLAPLSMLVALVCLLWAIVYPIAKRMV